MVAFGAALLFGVFQIQGIGIAAFTPLGNKYALAALREKRATLAGEIQSLKRQAQWKQRQLEAVDESLRLFDPDYVAGSIKPKKTYQRVHLFKQGQLTGAILNALREAGRPLSTADLVTAVLAGTGAGEAGRRGLNHRVRASLQYLSRERRTVEKQGSGRGVTWALVG